MRPELDLTKFKFVAGKSFDVTVQGTRVLENEGGQKTNIVRVTRDGTDSVSEFPLPSSQEFSPGRRATVVPMTSKYEGGGSLTIYTLRAKKLLPLAA